MPWPTLLCVFTSSPDINELPRSILMVPLLSPRDTNGQYWLLRFFDLARFLVPECSKPRARPRSPIRMSIRQHSSNTCGNLIRASNELVHEAGNLTLPMILFHLLQFPHLICMLDILAEEARVYRIDDLQKFIAEDPNFTLKRYYLLRGLFSSAKSGRQY